MWLICGWIAIVAINLPLLAACNLCENSPCACFFFCSTLFVGVFCGNVSFHSESIADICIQIRFNRIFTCAIWIQSHQNKYIFAFHFHFTSKESFSMKMITITISSVEWQCEIDWNTIVPNRMKQSSDKSDSRIIENDIDACNDNWCYIIFHYVQYCRLTLGAHLYLADLRIKKNEYQLVWIGRSQGFSHA